MTIFERFFFHPLVKEKWGIHKAELLKFDAKPDITFKELSKLNKLALSSFLK